MSTHKAEFLLHTMLILHVTVYSVHYFFSNDQWNLWFYSDDYDQVTPVTLIRSNDEMQNFPSFAGTDSTYMRSYPLRTPRRLW